MSTIVLRLVKGVPLTNAELDDNFSNLNTDKLEAGTTATLTNKTINLSSNTFVATSAQMATAVSDKTGSGALVFATSPTLVTPALGTPASGVVTNLTGTASININGTVGATTATTGAFTTLTTSSTVTINGGTANGVAYLNGSKVLTTGSALTFDGAKLNNINGASLGVIQSTDTVSTGSFVRMLGDAFAGNLINWKNDTVLRFATSADNFSTYTERMRISGIGEVGIGTINPGTKLHVYGNGTTSNNYTNGDATGATLFLQDSNGASGNGGQLLFGSSQGIYAGIKGFVTNGTGPAGDLLFQTRGASGNVNERMRIDSAGNVGIGTSSPTAPLDVNGNLAITGSARRITGDFSNATAANRVAFQNSTTNAQTILTVIPNGTSTASALAIEGDSAVANGTNAVFSLTSTDVRVSSSGRGTFTYLPMTFYTGGSERVRIDTSGNVGIGTSSPTAKLDVATSINLGLNYLNVGFDIGSGAGWLGGYNVTYSSGVKNVNLGSASAVSHLTGAVLFHTNVSAAAGTAVPERMRIDTSGNVGIGTSSPLGNLQVSGTTKALTGGYGQLNVFSTDAIGANKGGKISFGGVSGAAGFDPYGFCSIAGYKDNATASNFSGYLQFSTATSGGTVTERMRIDSSGNVGIGTSSPATKLHVATAANTGVLVSSTDGTTFKGIAFNTSDNQFTVGTQTNHPVAFFSNNTERMRIDSSGNLLVGTTASEGPSRISSVSTATGTACVGYRNTAGAGSTFAYFINSSNSALIGSISNNGNTGTLYNVTSDYRLKTVIGPVADAGQRIDALQPVEYTWNSDGSRTRGFLAHQFQEVYTGSVTGSKDAVDAKGKPVYQAMQASSSEVIADLVAEIQSLRARVAALESN